jgi:hypothetical protein
LGIIVFLDIGCHGGVLGNNGINCSLFLSDGSSNGCILGFFLLINECLPGGGLGGNNGLLGSDSGVNAKSIGVSISDEFWVWHLSVSIHIVWSFTGSLGVSSVSQEEGDSDVSHVEVG